MCWGITQSGSPTKKRGGQNLILEHGHPERHTHPGVCVDVGMAIPDLGGWRSVPGPKPDLDEGRRAFHGEQTASVRVKGWTERVSTGIRNGAPRITVHESVTIRCQSSTGLTTAGRYGAPRRGVEGHSVWADVVDTLDDVDFTIVRPVGQTGLPDRGPGTTALWHVPNVEAVGNEMQHQ